LEYDERFAVFKEFVRYDFEKAIQLPAEMKGSFDRIICDPPFLSEDCQTKGRLGEIQVDKEHADLVQRH
jgi:methylase of polypeptide subunit release factors|tara:strand:+ start:36111 stop:36317 length:207 start_codon:yes stop_codon:yes gene_type:complete